MAKDSNGEVKICVVCKRDPRVPPPDWKGSPEKWAARVKVVAFERCAKDYQAMRRPKSKRGPDRKGVTARGTVWMTPDDMERATKVAEKRGKSFSEFGAHAIKIAVAAAERHAKPE